MPSSSSSSPQNDYRGVPSSEPMVAALETDGLCHQFESEWKAGRQPRLEDYLSRVISENRLGVLRQLLAIELRCRMAQAEQPQEAEYVQRLPHFAGAIRTSWEDMRIAPEDSPASADVSTILSENGQLPHSAYDSTVPPAVASPHYTPHGAILPPAVDHPFHSAYELIEELGRGGMGIVYRARDRRTGLIVALKTLQGFSAPALYRFKNEFRALADVTHSNLVMLHELVYDGQKWCITMEFIEGVDFRTYVRQGKQGPLTADQVDRLRDAIRQLAQGIVALHGAGHLHRDIKPRNVMATSEGRVVVLDFGLVAELSREGLHQSTEHHVLGTVAYMSPEQAGAQALSVATDWYSVGVMLYEALTGQLPFRGPLLTVLRAKQEEDPAPPSALVTGVPSDLEQLCLQLMDRDPQARPTDEDMLRLLQCPTEDSVGASTRPGQDTAELIGRDLHLSVLRNAFVSMQRRQAVAVFVHGQSGVGKTALVRRFLQDVANHRDAVTLSGRCYEQESISYKAVDSLIDRLTHYLAQLPTVEVRAFLPRDVLLLAKLFPVLRRVDAIATFPYLAEIRDPQETRRRAFVALRELFARLGDHAPLVLYIDDLQWGDLDSLELLTEILRPPEAPRLLFIGSYRSEDIASSPFLRAMTDARRRLDRSFDWRELSVEPLMAADAHKLATSLLERVTSSKHADTIAKESGGNPLFVQELVRHLSSAAADSTDAALMDDLTLDSVLWRRYQMLDPVSQRLLGILCVAGRPLRCSDACLAAAFSSDPTTVVRALRAARLLRSASQAAPDHIEPYHDRIRETIAARLDNATCREYHIRLFEILEQNGETDPEQLATHLEQAGAFARSAEYYRRAAEQAAQSLAFDHASTLYRQSLKLGSHTGGEKRLLQGQLGDALANAGRGREAAEQYMTAAEGASGADSFEWRHKAAKQLLISGHIDDGVQSLRTILASINMKMPSTPTSALLSLLFNRALLQLRGLRFHHRNVDEVPPAQLAKVDVCWSAAIGLCLVDTVQGMYFQTRGLLLALKAGEPFRIARAISLEASHRSTAGTVAESRANRLFGIAAELNEPVNHPYNRAMLKLMTAAGQYLYGRFKAAYEDLKAAEQTLRDECIGVTWELDTAHTFSLWSETYLGSIARLSERWPALLQEARSRGNRYAVTYFSTYIMAMVRLGADDAEVAWSQLQDVMSQWPVTGFHVQHHNALLAHTLIQLYRGQKEDAWKYLQANCSRYRKSHLIRVQQIRIDLTGLRARCALALATEASNPRAMLRFALSDLRRLRSERAPWADAVACLTQAGICAVQNNMDQAIVQYRTAADALDGVDMKLYAASARRRLGEILGGDEGRRLVEAADLTMKSEKIRDPQRFSKILAPKCLR